MADRSVVVKLTAQVNGYVSAMKQASSATDDVAKKATAAGKQTEDANKRSSNSAAALGKGLAVAGTLMAAGFGFAVKTAADFDKAMSGVRANIDTTPAQFQELSNAVRGAGTQYGYTATESASATEELAKAGLSAKEIIGGGLTGALTLAAAGGVSTGEAAETAANAMSMFGLKAKDVGHIADVLANGANQSTASIGSLAQGLAQGGNVAASFGLTLEDTTATLAMFDQAGLKGSDAGTSLKTMLTALAKPSEQAAKTMQQLGIETFDAQGKFIGMAGLQEQLKTKLAGLTQEQRNQALATIFGSDAMRAANVLFNDTTGFEKWRDGVSKSGTAAENARTRMDNLSGDLTKLKASFQNALIGGGEGATSAFRPLVQLVTGAVDAFSKLPGPVQQAAVVLAGLGAGGLVAVAGISKVSGIVKDGIGIWRDSKDAISGWATKLADSDSKVTRFAGSAAKAGAAGAILATTFVGLAQILGTGARSVDEYADGLDKMAKSTGGITAGNLDKQFDGLAESWNRLNSSGDWMNKTEDFIANTLGQENNTQIMADQFKNLGEAIANIYKSSPTQAAAAFNAVMKETGATREQLLKYMPAYAAALDSEKSKATAATSPTKQLADAISGTSTTAGTAKQDIDELAKAIKGLGSAQLDARGSARDYQASLDDAAAALKENGHTLDITTKKGRDNAAALDQIASSTTSWASSQVTLGGSIEQSNSILDEGKSKYIAMATAMGMPKEQAKQLADSLFQLPPGVTTAVSVPGVEGATYAVDKLGQQVIKLPSGVTIPVSTPNAANVAGLLDTVKSSALSADKASVVIDTSAPGAPSATELIRIFGAKAVSVNGTKVTVSATALTGQAMDALAGLQVALGNLPRSKSINVDVTRTNRNINITENRTSYTTGPQFGGFSADGRVTLPGGHRFMDDGGFAGRQATIAPAGKWITWAEDETGGEAYIPLAQSKRARSRMIADKTVDLLGGRIAWAADGRMSASARRASSPAQQRVSVSATASLSPADRRLILAAASNTGQSLDGAVLQLQFGAEKTFARVVTKQQSQDNQFGRVATVQ